MGIPGLGYRLLPFLRISRAGGPFGRQLAVFLPQLLVLRFVVGRACAESYRLLAVASAGDDFTLSGDAVARNRHIVVGLDLLPKFEGLTGLWVLLFGDLLGEPLTVADEFAIFGHSRAGE